MNENKISKISVYPESGNFMDIIVGSSYIQTFTVKNLSDRLLSVRISSPIQSEFRLETSLGKRKKKKTVIAPGLDMVFNVIFYAEEEKKQGYHDQISIVTNTETMIIPLNAYLPRCSIISPSSFDLGTVMPNGTTSKYFTIQNYGSLEGKFSFEFEDLPIRIIPKEGVLLPNSNKQIKVQYKSIEAVGVHQYTVLLKLDNDETRKIEIIVNVVECRIFLCYSDKGGSVSSIEFEKIYYGQKKRKKFILSNTSGFEASFLFHSRNVGTVEEYEACEHCGYRHSSEEDCEVAKKKNLTNFFVSPSKGMIGPFEQKSISVWFEPKYGKKLFGFRSGEQASKAFDEDWVMMIAKRQKVDFTISGSATKPVIAMSNTKLRFRNCPVNECRDIMLELSNSCDLSARFQINRVAHFYATPSKGKLAAFSKKQINITFHPNQQGFFSNRMICSIEKGLKKISLHVVGQSEKISKKKKLNGGIDKLPQDFRKLKTYVNSASILDKNESFENARPVKKRFKFYDKHANKSTSIIKLQELRDKKNNQDLFNAYVTTLRQQKEIKKRKKMIERLHSNFMNDVDLGMIPSSGLYDPVPSLKLKEAKLFTKIDFSMVSKISKRREMDENVLVKKKFKPYPTKENEKREVKIKLSKKQMQKILTFPRTMDFGEMTVFAKNTKSFGIRNNLKQFILVQVGEKEGEVSVHPESQVIPPMSQAGFDVTLCSKESQSVNQNLFFSVNRKNNLRLLITAEVIPAKVVLSRSELKFRFNEYSLDPFIDETVTLTNRGNAIANFEFIQQRETKDKKDLFEISPNKGTIEPLQTKQVHVIFNPNSAYRVIETFILKVKGALSDKPLKCIADLKEAKLRSKEKKIDFKVHPVGMMNTETVTLKNIGEEGAVFRVDENLDPDIKVIPMKGKVPKKSSIRLTVELNPTSPRKYRSHLIVHVRAGKQVKILMIGESRTPNVMLVDTPDTMDFGKVFMGGKRREKVSIKNVGENIPAVLFLDLTEYTDFTVEDENNQLVTLENAGKNVSVVPIFTEEEFLDDDSDDLVSDVEDMMSDGVDYVEGLKFQLMIPPGEVLSLYLVYKPTLPEIAEFKLKLYLAGMEHESIGKNIIAEGLKPKLVFSQAVIDFRSKVVIKESMIPHRVVVSMSNEDDQDLHWFLGKKELESTGVFKADPLEGRLRVGQSGQLHVFFLPSELKEYKLKVPVYLKAKDWDLKIPYTYLNIIGSGSYPKISFSVDEVVLPVVPLGITAIAEVRILNDGYEKLTLKYKLPADTDKVPLSIKFPKGKVIGRDTPEIIAEISFMSKKPMSFTSKIEFFDEARKCYPLKISATTDNCILTTYNFIHQNRDAYSLQSEGAGKSIMIVPNTINENEEEGEEGLRRGLHENEGMSAAVSVYSFATSMSKLTSSAKALRQLFSRRSLKRLLNWLNATVMENPVDDLIRMLKNSRGKALFEIVQVLSGKKLPLPAYKVSKNKFTDAKNRVAIFASMISYLKGFGALFSHLRPYYFLSFEEYKVLQDKGFVKTRCNEIVFRYRNIEAWVSTIYQVIKLFALKRITLSSFRSNRGIPKEVSGKSDRSLSMSNILSLQENILLKWFTYHVRKAYPEYKSKRIVSFGKDLSDSVVFAAVLKNHIQYLSPLLSGLIVDPLQQSEFEQNAMLIISSLKEAKIQYEMNIQDIIQGNHRDLLLFSIFLYQILPQYISKSNIIFEGNLSETITKSIEISNPSRQNVEYTVFLEYLSQKKFRKNEFTIHNDLIYLKPKSKCLFPITVCPNFTQKSTGRLTFFPKKVGSYRPDVMVFNLETRVQTSQVSESFEVRSSVLSVKQLDIPIKNVFEKNGIFKITLEQSNNCKDDDRKFLPDPFWITRDHITIKGKTTKKLTLHFLPFDHNYKYYMKIYFNDPKVGEFIYGIIGTATKNEEVNQMLEYNSQIGIVLKKEIKLRASNAKVDKAMQLLRERNKKYRHTVTNMERSRIPDVIKIPFRVSYSNPKFTGPKNFIFNPESSKDTFNFNFSSKVAGIFHCYVELNSEYDRRLMQIKVTSRAPGVKAELVFNVPVRKKVQQEIPIQNRTNEAWLIQATLKGDSRFIGPSEVHVPSKKTVSYPLTFSPFFKKNTTGELTLVNPSTMEKYIFTLIGNVEDPIANGRINIECMAREKKKVEIVLKKIGVEKSRMQVFKVESDLEFLKFEKEFVVDEGDNRGTFVMNCHPSIGGSHIGSITFTSRENGEVSWYVVEVKVNRSNPEREITLKNVIRKKKNFEILIENPVNQEVTYFVQLDGDGLDGEDQIVLKPRAKLKYRIEYLPLVVGEEIGTISFFNDEHGEFWYSLVLVANAPDPIVVDEIRCEIGKERIREIPVKCPDLVEEPIVMDVRSTNRKNFKVENDHVQVSPYEPGYIRLKYFPSSFNVRESTTITVSNPQYGNWTYQVDGIGLKPTKVETMKIYAEEGKSSSVIVMFKNPFPVRRKFSVEMLVGEKIGAGTFSIATLQKSTKKRGIGERRSKKKKRKGIQILNLKPYYTISLPITFNPPTVGEYNAELVIKTIGDITRKDKKKKLPSEELRWRYVLLGITEVVNEDIHFHFRCKAREKLSKRIIVPLKGISFEDIIKNPLKFSHELEIPKDQSFLRAIKRSIKLKRLNTPKFSGNRRKKKSRGRLVKFGEVEEVEGESDEENEKTGEDEPFSLSFNVDFYPLRPFDGFINLIVRSKKIGVWKFEIQLTSMPPEEDDIIEIQAVIGRREKIAFYLNNIFAHHAPFEAYFSPETPIDFAVYPEKGVLAAKGYEGTEFTVSYKAVQYGKMANGMLIIDTEEMQWRYKLKGVLPKIKKIKKDDLYTDLDNQLSPEIKKTLNRNRRLRKNFLKHNIEKSANTRKRKRKDYRMILI